VQQPEQSVSPPNKPIERDELTTRSRVIRWAIVLGVATIGDLSVDDVAMLEAEERASGLCRGVEIGGRESEGRKAEGVSGVCFLCRDDAAAGPLVSAIAAGEGDGADDAVAIDDGCPHVEVETAVGLKACGGEGCAKGAV